MEEKKKSDESWLIERELEKKTEEHSILWNASIIFIAVSVSCLPQVERSIWGALELLCNAIGVSIFFGIAYFVSTLLCEKYSRQLAEIFAICIGVLILILAFFGISVADIVLYVIGIIQGATPVEY